MVIGVSGHHANIPLQQCVCAVNHEGWWSTRRMYALCDSFDTHVIDFAIGRT